eukprot:s349_g17.t1
MPLRHTVLRGEAKPKPRNVPPLDSCQGDRSNSKRATAGVVSGERDAVQRKVHDKGREEDPVDCVERKTVSDVRSGSKGMSRRSKAVPAQVADGNEDHSQSYPERIGSKESTGSNGRFKKQISRLSSKTALMSEDPTQQFGGTLRGYLDFLYREAEQQLMWEKLDAATNRLSTIQEAQDLERRPVVSLTSRNSISQMKSARTAAFETLEDEEVRGLFIGSWSFEPWMDLRIQRLEDTVLLLRDELRDLRAEVRCLRRELRQLRGEAASSHISEEPCRTRRSPPATLCGVVARAALGVSQWLQVPSTVKHPGHDLTLDMVDLLAELLRLLHQLPLRALKLLVWLAVLLAACSVSARRLESEDCGDSSSGYPLRSCGWSGRDSLAYWTPAITDLEDMDGVEAPQLPEEDLRLVWDATGRVTAAYVPQMYT